MEVKDLGFWLGAGSPCAPLEQLLNCVLSNAVYSHANLMPASHKQLSHNPQANEAPSFDVSALRSTDNEWVECGHGYCESSVTEPGFAEAFHLHIYIYICACAHVCTYA